MGLTASIVGEIHVLLAAALMFVVLPWWALSRVRKKAGTGASTLAAGFSFWIVAVTVLAYVNSLRYSVLFVIVLLAFVAAWRVGARAPVEAPAEQRGRVWDVFERPRQALDNQMVRLRESWQQAWRAMHSDYGTVGMVLAGAAMLWALVYGSWPWLHQADPGTPQGYANLLRIASFTANTGVYPGGAVPVGLPALGAAISTAFFLPSMEVLRFLYPLAGVFTVIAVGALAHQLTRSGRMTALIMFLASVSSIAHLGFPDNFQSPLAMRWAMVLVLIAWAEAVAWSQSPENHHAILVGFTLLGASLISPPEGLLGAVVAAGIVWGREGQVVRVVTGGFSAVILGVVPVAVGLMTGHAWNPEGWLVVPFARLSNIWVTPGLSAYASVWIGLGIAALNVLRSTDPVRKRLSWLTGAMALAAALLGHINTVASTMLWSDALGLMVLLLGLDLLLVPAVTRPQYRLGVNVVLIAVAVVGALRPANSVTLMRFDPPLAGHVTLQIEQTLPPYQWTIVSPTEQYSEILGRGWHEELASFVTTYSIQDAMNPHYLLRTDSRNPILSPDVFIFVEPRLYPDNQRVSPAAAHLPIASGPNVYSGHSLKAIESRAYYWVVAYHRSHPNSSTIYARDKNLMVLWIRQ